MTIILTLIAAVLIVIGVTIAGTLRERKEKDRIFENKLKRIFDRTATNIELGQLYFKAQDEKLRNEKEKDTSHTGTILPVTK